MARSVDPRLTRKALRSLAKLKAAAEDPERPAEFSEWEGAFIEGVSERLETFGSAFADYGKGAPEEALSRLQQAKLRELAKKARSRATQSEVSAPADKPAFRSANGLHRRRPRPDRD